MLTPNTPIMVANKALFTKPLEKCQLHIDNISFHHIVRVRLEGDRIHENGKVDQKHIDPTKLRELSRNKTKILHND